MAPVKRKAAVGRQRIPGPKPLTRPLKAYAFDPSAGKLLGNEMSMNVPYQNLDPGPVVVDWVSNAIAVVDYDGANGVYYDPVDLNDKNVLIRGGVEVSEADPHFHQQMVYAVVTDTIQHFEKALGRRIHWRRAPREGGTHTEAAKEDIWNLNIFPHAFIGQNAFYSPSAHGILFGYFKAGSGDVGRNLPGQTVFTCLSHDVVVHETTHAIVDGLRGFFTEQTNQDVAAFHEGFADLAALFRHFTHKEALLDTIERTGGRLYQYQLRPDAEVSGYDDYANRDGSVPDAGGSPLLSSQISSRNPLIELAQQFGEATGKDRALRSALGSRPNAGDIRKFTEPHRRGSILVAAVFDAYFAIYLKKTADLWRIARGGNPNSTDISRSLANRLCDEATRVAELFFTLCVRALDYCPPVDITFGAYLRAIITADFDLHPIDDLGIRDALLQSFRLRGIFPEGATCFSENAACWPRASKELPFMEGLDFGDPNGFDQGDPKQGEMAATLRAYVEENKEALGFAKDLPVTIPSFHPVFRVSPDGRLRTDLVVEVMQTVVENFDPGSTKFGQFRVRTGATLIIRKPIAGEPGVKNNQAKIRYIISRGTKATPERIDGQRHLGERLGLATSESSDRFRIDFASLHGGF